MVNAIGIDIGGTRIKAGLVTNSGLTSRLEEKTPKDPAMLMQAIENMCRKLRRGEQSIGIAIAGLLSPEKDRIINSPNLRWIESFPLKSALEKSFGCPITLANDATAATVAENSFGTGKKCEHFLLATLGTGIGGGIVLNGHIWEGPGGLAGEFGHTYANHSEMCSCGNIGCVEAAASATAMEKTGKQNGLKFSLKTLAEKAREGDLKAQTIFQKAGNALGNALGQATLLLDVRVLVLGGGASPCTDLLTTWICKEASHRAFGRKPKDFSVIESPLGNDAGILGAAKLAK